MYLNDVKLTWFGELRVVNSRRVMDLVDAIEEHATMYELTSKRGVRNARLAKGYHAALTFAGFSVDKEEVFVSLFVNNEDGENATVNATLGLLSMMSPPEEALEKFKKKLSQSQEETGSSDPHTSVL